MSASYAHHVSVSLVKDGCTGMARILDLVDAKVTRGQKKRPTRNARFKRCPHPEEDHEPHSRIRLDVSISDICGLTKGHPGTVVKVVVHKPSSSSAVLCVVHLEDGQWRFEPSEPKMNPRLEPLIVDLQMDGLDQLAMSERFLSLELGIDVLGVMQ
jgi:hypothetical protein